MRRAPTVRVRRASAAALVVAALCVVGAATSASAQTTVTPTPPGDTPSVGVTPTESRPDDPNSGQWFVFSIEPGGAGRTRARVGNPATIPQTVKLYLADLVFGRDGTPTIPERQPTDIGAWGAFDQQVVTVPPKEFVFVEFSLQVPPDADPGDHVGAVVAESQPEGGALKIIKRVATRLYVTVPGDATKSFTIARVSKSVSSTWLPRRMAVTTLLRNTGRVRLSPTVRVNGVVAKGPDPLLARSVERYLATVPVPWYGGPVTARVTVETAAGTKAVSVSVFVIPWGPLAMIPVAVAALAALRALARLRTRKVRALQADLRRLEKLVTERQTGEAAAMAALAEHGEAVSASTADDGASVDGDRVRSLRAGIKRAQRAGAQDTLEHLALALHETGEDARGELLAALEHAGDGSGRDALEAALATYGSAAPAEDDPHPGDEEPPYDPFVGYVETPVVGVRADDKVGSGQN